MGLKSCAAYWWNAEVGVEAWLCVNIVTNQDGLAPDSSWLEVKLL
jgi:hypothetical protein